MPDPSEPDLPKTLFWTADVTARTQFLLPEAEHVEALPFDGIVVNVPASWDLMSPGVRLERADVRRWLEPLAELNAGMDNFLLAIIDRPGALEDDAAWAGAARNWRIVAEEAERAGLRGLLLDNEEYSGRWQDYEGPPEGLAAAQALAPLSAGGR